TAIPLTSNTETPFTSNGARNALDQSGALSRRTISATQTEKNPAKIVKLVAPAMNANLPIEANAIAIARETRIAGTGVRHRGCTRANTPGKAPSLDMP